MWLVLHYLDVESPETVKREVLLWMLASELLSYLFPLQAKQPHIIPPFLGERILNF